MWTLNLWNVIEVNNKYMGQYIDYQGAKKTFSGLFQTSSNYGVLVWKSFILAPKKVDSYNTPVICISWKI